MGFGTSLSRRRLLARVTSPVAAAMFATGAWGASITWDRGANSVNWNDANNWSSNSVPNDTSDVIFGTTGISSGDAFDLAGTSNTINSLTFNNAFFAASKYSLINGEINLTGHNSSGFNLEKLDPAAVTIAANLILGAPTVMAGLTNIAWRNSGTQSTSLLAISGNIAKANAGQYLTLDLSGAGAFLFTGSSFQQDQTLIRGTTTLRPASGGAVSFGSVIGTDANATFIVSGATSSNYELTSTFDSTLLNTAMQIRVESAGGSPTFQFTGELNAARGWQSLHRAQMLPLYWPM